MAGSRKGRPSKRSAEKTDSVDAVEESGLTAPESVAADDGGAVESHLETAAPVPSPPPMSDSLFETVASKKAEQTGVPPKKVASLGDQIVEAVRRRGGASKSDVPSEQEMSATTDPDAQNAVGTQDPNEVPTEDLYANKKLLAKKRAAAEKRKRAHSQSNEEVPSEQSEDENALDNGRVTYDYAASHSIRPVPVPRNSDNALSTEEEAYGAGRKKPRASKDLPTQDQDNASYAEENALATDPESHRRKKRSTPPAEDINESDNDHTHVLTVNGMGDESDTDNESNLDHLSALNGRKYADRLTKAQYERFKRKMGVNPKVWALNAAAVLDKAGNRSNWEGVLSSYEDKMRHCGLTGRGDLFGVTGLIGLATSPIERFAQACGGLIGGERSRELWQRYGHLARATCAMEFMTAGMDTRVSECLKELEKLPKTGGNEGEVKRREELQGMIRQYEFSTERIFLEGMKGFYDQLLHIYANGGQLNDPSDLRKLHFVTQIRALGYQVPANRDADSVVRSIIAQLKLDAIADPMTDKARRARLHLAHIRNLFKQEEHFMDRHGHDVSKSSAAHLKFGGHSVSQIDQWAERNDVDFQRYTSSSAMVPGDDGDDNPHLYSMFQKAMTKSLRNDSRAVAHVEHKTPESSQGRTDFANLWSPTGHGNNGRVSTAWSAGVRGGRRMRRKVGSLLASLTSIATCVGVDTRRYFAPRPVVTFDRGVNTASTVFSGPTLKTEILAGNHGWEANTWRLTNFFRSAYYGWANLKETSSGNKMRWVGLRTKSIMSCLNSNRTANGAYKRLRNDIQRFVTMNLAGGCGTSASNPITFTTKSYSSDKHAVDTYAHIQKMCILALKARAVSEKRSFFYSHNGKVIELTSQPIHSAVLGADGLGKISNEDERQFLSDILKDYPSNFIDEDMGRFLGRSSHAFQKRLNIGMDIVDKTLKHTYDDEELKAQEDNFILSANDANFDRPRNDEDVNQDILTINTGFEDAEFAADPFDDEVAATRPVFENPLYDDGSGQVRTNQDRTKGFANPVYEGVNDINELVAAAPLFHGEAEMDRNLLETVNDNNMTPEEYRQMMRAAAGKARRPQPNYAVPEPLSSTPIVELAEAEKIQLSEYLDDIAEKAREAESARWDPFAKMETNQLSTNENTPYEDFLMSIQQGDGEFIIEIEKIQPEQLRLLMEAEALQQVVSEIFSNTDDLDAELQVLQSASTKVGKRQAIAKMKERIREQLAKENPPLKADMDAEAMDILYAEALMDKVKQTVTEAAMQAGINNEDARNMIAALESGEVTLTVVAGVLSDRQTPTEEAVDRFDLAAEKAERSGRRQIVEKGNNNEGREVIDAVVEVVKAAIKNEDLAGDDAADKQELVRDLVSTVQGSKEGGSAKRKAEAQKDLSVLVIAAVAEIAKVDQTIMPASADPQMSVQLGDLSVKVDRAKVVRTIEATQEEQKRSQKQELDAELDAEGPDAKEEVAESVSSMMRLGGKRGGD